jgi:transcriptional regulator NrdR family protein
MTGRSKPCRIRCPECDHVRTRVRDSRGVDDLAVMRERECLSCLTRFLTVETIWDPHSDDD